MGLIDWVPTTITAIATVVVAIATVYYARVLKNNAIKETERPRKMDEINLIIYPLLSPCNGEQNQLNHKWYDFLKFELFSEEIQKNSYKRMVFNSFINGKKDLVTSLNEHEKIIRSLTEKHKTLVKTIDTDDFRNKINKLHRGFNQKNPHLKFSQEIDSLSKQIIKSIVENKDVNVELLGDPFENFWAINRKYFLDLKEKREPKKHIKEIETLSNQLIEKNKSIIKNLEEILDIYTKKYGLSLEKELIPFM